QKGALSADAGDVHVQGTREPLFGHSLLDRFQDHLVFLDDRDAADALVVRECLVLGGHETHNLGLSTGPKDVDPDMAVKQVEEVAVRTVPDHDGRFDDADFRDGGGDLAILNRFDYRGSKLPKRHYVGQGDAEARRLER